MTTTSTRTRQHRATNTTVTLDVVYLRISLSRDAEQVATDRQLFEVAERRMEEENRTGVSVPVEVFRDENISASMRKPRKGYQAMLALIASRRPGTTRIWTYEPSRLTRHPMELEELIDALDRGRVLVRTVNAGDYDLTTPEGRMTARVVGAVARQEVERKAERNSSKHYDLARHGQLLGRRPFGFMRNPAHRKGDASPKWLVCEEEAAVVREAVQRVLDGEACGAIARDFTKRGLTTNLLEPERGHGWNSRRVHEHLQSPHLAGLRIYNEMEYPADESTGWVPLVPREDWKQVQYLMSDPLRETRAPATPYLLNGLAYTSTGYAMRGRGAKVRVPGGGKGARRFYTSSTVEALQPRPPEGEGAAVLEEDLDDLVLRAVFALTDKHPVGTPTTDFKRRAALVAQREQLEAQLADALALHREGAFGKNPRQYLDYISVPQRELDEVSEQLHSMAPVSSSVAAMLATPGALRKGWSALDFNTMRTVLRTVVERVEVAPATTRGARSRLKHHPKRVNVRWRDA